ncbi:hypothetical protein ACEQ8H_007556 [Pleosporales sp. CAS-2024a]
MAQPLRSLPALLAALFLLLLVTPALAAWDLAYCSSQNTASTDVYTQTFMSNGNCTNHCRQEGAWAFAVIKYQDCYCSNYIPRDQQDMTKCQVTCPGYGAEFCGNIDDGLFIYIENGTPSGTASAPASAQRTSSSASSPGSNHSPQSDAPTQIRTVTISGGIVTQTIMPTVPSSSKATSSPAPASTDKDDDNALNVGAIAGGVAGGVIGFVAIAGGIIFFLWRRRKPQQEAQGDDHAGGITRNTSTMSKAGLLGGSREADYPIPSRIATNVSPMNSRFGSDHESISPVSNRRNSQPLVIDSRLNPNAVMTFAGSNRSRESVVSLDDSRDYGRQLNVRNPDPS